MAGTPPGRHPDHHADPGPAPLPRSGGRTRRSSTPTTPPLTAAAIPPNAYKPFGTGIRACIGRQFALQEAVLVLGLLLQRFDFIDHLHYQLMIKTTLTVKPDDFHILVRPRPGRGSGRTGRPAAARPATAEDTGAPSTPAVDRHGTPLAVLFGSNLGTAESIATRLAQEGTERGFASPSARSTNTWATCPATAQPPDQLLLQRHPTGQRGSLLPVDQGPARRRGRGLAYTVFGCGNTEWAATYQAVPTLLDTQLAAHGGRRVHPRGEGNAAGDFDAAYRDWHATLWADLAARAGPAGGASAQRHRRPVRRLCITLTNRQSDEPGHRVLPGQRRRRCASTAS